MKSKEGATTGGIDRGLHAKLHRSLAKKYGKANKCENKNCESVSPKRYEWALKKGHKYSDDIKDYKQLCPSCHRKYDDNPERRAKLSRIHKGKHYHGRDKVVKRISFDGEVVVYPSISDAARKNNFKNNSGICNCIAGRYKTSKGFIWKYF